jgi:hypothetical protein
MGLSEATLLHGSSSTLPALAHLDPGLLRATHLPMLKKRDCSDGSGKARHSCSLRMSSLTIRAPSARNAGESGPVSFRVLLRHATAPCA